MHREPGHDDLDFPRPLVCVDVIVFTVMQGVLHVLLARRPSAPGEPFPGAPCLPGGFIDVARDDSLLQCALRKLHEKTGFSSPYLEQLGSWGNAARDPRGWSATHAYFALVPPPDMPVAAARDVEWVPVERAAQMPLAFDHSEIFSAALGRLRGKVEYTSLPAYLLPEPFTLPQLQQTYEIVLGRPVDKSGFRTRMLAAGFLEEAGLATGLAKRPTMTYRLASSAQPVLFPRTFAPRGPG